MNARKSIVINHEMYKYMCNRYDVRLGPQGALYVWAKENVALKTQTTK